MRNNSVKTVKMAGISIGLGLMFSMAVLAAESEEADTEAVTETVAEAKEATVIEQIALSFEDGQTLLLDNALEEKIAELYVRKAFEPEWGENLLEDNTPLPSEDTISEVYDLKVVCENGESLFYPNLKLADLDTLQLMEEDGAVSVNYHDRNQDTETDMQSWVMEASEEAQTLYTKSRLNVRELPDTQAEILATLELGEEIEAYGTAQDWYLIRSGEGYGYVSGAYVTDSREEAEQLAAEAEAQKRAEEEAAAQAQAAAQQAAAQQASQSKQQSGSGKKTETKQTEAKQTEAKQTEAQPETQPETQPQTQATVYEISRENVPGCDDPNHGTTYITYSDGSVEAVDY